MNAWPQLPDAARIDRHVRGGARRGERVAFRAISAQDLPVLAQWLERPHWREWWGDPGEELGYIRDMIEERDDTRPYIFSIDGVDAGYIQVWFVGLHQNPQWAADHPWLMELPAHSVGVDLSLADGSSLSQGLGSLVLRAFVARLREAGCASIVIDPDPENGRAMAAYMKAGFRPIPGLEGRFAGVTIMQHHLDPNLTP